MASHGCALLFLALSVSVQGSFLNRDEPLEPREAPGTKYYHDVHQQLAAHKDVHSVAHYKCDEACQKASEGLSVQSRCVTECEQAMYDCWDHSTGKAQYETCKKELFDKFSKFDDSPPAAPGPG